MLTLWKNNEKKKERKILPKVRQKKRDFSAILCVVISGVCSFVAVSNCRHISVDSGRWRRQTEPQPVLDDLGKTAVPLGQGDSSVAFTSTEVQADPASDCEVGAWAVQPAAFWLCLADLASAPWPWDVSHSCASASQWSLWDEANARLLWVPGSADQAPSPRDAWTVVTH